MTNILFAEPEKEISKRRMVLKWIAYGVVIAAITGGGGLVIFRYLVHPLMQ